MSKIPFGAHVKVVSQTNCSARRNPCHFCTGNTGTWSETDKYGKPLPPDSNREGFLIYDNQSKSSGFCSGLRSENLQIIYKCKLHRDSR